MWFLFLFLFLVTTVDSRLFEGDIALAEGQAERVYGLRIGRDLGVLSDTLGLWRRAYKNGRFRVPYSLTTHSFREGNNRGVSRANVESLLRSFEDVTGNIVEFVDVDVDDEPAILHGSYLAIGDFETAEGCWSYVGLIPDRTYQEINLGVGCLNRRIVHHELLHALGFWHEQSRPDRDEHVRIIWENIDDGLEDQFQKAVEVYSRGSAYDVGSIMHYSSDAFARSPGLRTIETLEGEGIAPASELSERDVEQFALLYRCPIGPRHISTNCDYTCPCDLGHGVCRSHSACVGDYVCMNQTCVENEYNITKSTFVYFPNNSGNNHHRQCLTLVLVIIIIHVFF